MSLRSPRSNPPGEAAVRRFTHNPFHVLDLAVDATAADVRRAAARLIDRLANGDPEAARYATPLGTQPRDEALVRRAASTLRDPDERVQLEIWAAGPTGADRPRTLEAVGDVTDHAAWPEAPTAFGWRPR